jgi:hypothetical protein
VAFADEMRDPVEACVDDVIELVLAGALCDRRQADISPEVWLAIKAKLLALVAEMKEQEHDE